MLNSETLWAFETARFRVEWQVSPCTDLDLSWDDTGEVRENLKSGLWCAFDAAMVVYLDGREIAADYLGQSIYENPSEFRDHIGIAAKSRADGRNYGSHFSDMARNAISEARRYLASHPAPRMRAA